MPGAHQSGESTLLLYHWFGSPLSVTERTLFCPQTEKIDESSRLTIPLLTSALYPFRKPTMDGGDRYGQDDTRRSRSTRRGDGGTTADSGECSSCERLAKWKEGISHWIDNTEPRSPERASESSTREVATRRDRHRQTNISGTGHTERSGRHSRRQHKTSRSPVDETRASCHPDTVIKQMQSMQLTEARDTAVGRRSPVGGTLDINESLSISESDEGLDGEAFKDCPEVRRVKRRQQRKRDEIARGVRTRRSSDRPRLTSREVSNSKPSQQSYEDPSVERSRSRSRRRGSARTGLPKSKSGQTRHSQDAETRDEPTVSLHKKGKHARKRTDDHREQWPTVDEPTDRPSHRTSDPRRNSRPPGSPSREPSSRRSRREASVTRPESTQIVPTSSHHQSTFSPNTVPHSKTVFLHLLCTQLTDQVEYYFPHPMSSRPSHWWDGERWVSLH